MDRRIKHEDDIHILDGADNICCLRDMPGSHLHCRVLPWPSKPVKRMPPTEHAVQGTRTSSSASGIIFFTIRYPIDVRVCAQCETEAQLATQECKDLALDEPRDTALLADILATLKFR